MIRRHQRTIPLNLSNLKVREAEDGGESRMIEGHAVVFGVRSVNLTPWEWSSRDVYEVIEPGAITQELIDKSDVVLTAFHNNEKILGRSTNGKGTLYLSLDGKGLFVRCELPKTATGDEMLEAIKRGDVSGMSFAFTDDSNDTENGVSYERMEAEKHDGKEVYVRHVKRIVSLYDVTIAGHPAYPQTDIAKREIDKYLDGILGAGEKTLEREEKDTTNDPIEDNPDTIARDDSKNDDDNANEEPKNGDGNPDDENEEETNTDGDSDNGEDAEDKAKRELELTKECELVERRQHGCALRQLRENFSKYNH